MDFTFIFLIFILFASLLSGDVYSKKYREKHENLSKELLSINFIWFYTFFEGFCSLILGTILFAFSSIRQSKNSNNKKESLKGKGSKKGSKIYAPYILIIVASIFICISKALFYVAAKYLSDSLLSIMRCIKTLGLMAVSYSMEAALYFMKKLSPDLHKKVTKYINIRKISGRQIISVFIVFAGSIIFSVSEIAEKMGITSDDIFKIKNYNSEKQYSCGNFVEFMKMNNTEKMYLLKAVAENIKMVSKIITRSDDAISVVLGVLFVFLSYIFVALGSLLQDSAVLIDERSAKENNNKKALHPFKMQFLNALVVAVSAGLITLCNHQNRDAFIVGINTEQVIKPHLTSCMFLALGEIPMFIILQSKGSLTITILSTLRKLISMVYMSLLGNQKMSVLSILGAVVSAIGVLIGISLPKKKI